MAKHSTTRSLFDRIFLLFSFLFFRPLAVSWRRRDFRVNRSVAGVIYARPAYSCTVYSISGLVEPLGDFHRWKSQREALVKRDSRCARQESRRNRLKKTVPGVNESVMTRLGSSMIDIRRWKIATLPVNGSRFSGTSLHVSIRIDSSSRKFNTIAPISPLC